MIQYQSNSNFVLVINSFISLKFQNSYNKIIKVEFDGFYENIVKNEIKNNFYIFQNGDLQFAIYKILPLNPKKSLKLVNEKIIPVLRKTKSYE